VKHYAMVEMDLTDREWIAAYVRDVTPMIERFGGRYLARTSRLEKMEGERAAPQVLTLTEWPSREAAMAFYDSDEYRPYRDSRLSGARCEFVLFPAEDITGAARIEE
jgi:uncharacterized protein (DUF1330 family)